MSGYCSRDGKDAVGNVTSSRKVSIIMPAFNVSAYLEEAIGSVFAQSYQNWELIVVDDGSTDQTAEILAGLHDPRVVVMCQANAGVSAARNVALNVATGEFVTFMDADDRLPPEALLHRVSYLESNPHVDIVNGAIRVTEGNRTLRTYVPSTAIVELFPKLAALDENFFFGPFYMVRRARIGAHRFPRGVSHCEDICFFLELAHEFNLIYGAVDAEVYEYRRSSSSAMSNLAGIETGYLALISLAARLKRMTSRQMLALRIRAASVMAKSWVRRGRPLNAFQAILNILVKT